MPEIGGQAQFVRQRVAGQQTAAPVGGGLPGVHLEAVVLPDAPMPAGTDYQRVGEERAPVFAGRRPELVPPLVVEAGLQQEATLEAPVHR